MTTAPAVVINMPSTFGTATTAAGVTVQSRAALAAIVAPASNQTANLIEAWREGQFKFLTSNQSANVTADPNQGIYVAPAADATGASGAWARIHTDVINVRWFGAVGDGSADDTLPLRYAFDVVRLAGGGEVFVPAGTYKVTRIPHPTQPFASPFLPSGGVGAILRLGDNATLRGEGRDLSIIKGIFPWQSAGADLTKSMTLINHGNNFTMEDIWVRGDYPEASPASFVFIPSNNGNSLVAATPASNIPIIGQHIRRCRLSHCPGFSVGTAEVLHATLKGNDILFCANGYNVSGSHIQISDNYWYCTEGVESAGSDASRIEAYHDPGSIQVVDNIFEEVTVACSLGGNIGVGAGSVSRGYVVVGNEVKSLLHSSSGGAIIIATNATEVIVSGNVVYGKFAEGVICTLSGAPAGTSPDAISIIGNRIHLTTTDAKGIYLDMEAGKVATVQGNRVKIDSGGAGIHATNAGTYYISENTLEARDAADISNATGTVSWDFRTNKHIPTDAAYATRLFAGLDTFSGTVTSYPIRRAIKPGAALTGLAYVVRVGGAGSIANDSNFVFAFDDAGKLQWGPTAGASAPDLTFERRTTGVAFLSGSMVTKPAASIAPTNNGELAVEATNNTTLTFKLKGGDGTVRSGTITLA